MLLASEDQPLLVRGDALLVLDLGLDVLDGVGGLDLKGDGLASEGLDEDLHTSPETEDKVEGGLLLDVVVGEGPSVLELLASEDQPLLVRGDALLLQHPEGVHSPPCPSSQGRYADLRQDP